MTPLYSLPLHAAPEVIDRIPSGYSNFVIPFVVGISFMLVWLTVGLFRLLAMIPSEDRRLFWKSLINPKIALKNIKDLFCDCLFHTKIWKRKPLLGYMHSSIAFGWFMLIVLGHLEVALFVPKHLAWTDGGLFYPIFYRFFVWINPGHVTLRGWFFFFLMDFFLLYVLTGVGMAIFKRFRSIVLGMRHTTKPSLADRVALDSLWMSRPQRRKFPDGSCQPSVALDLRRQAVLHAGVVGIFNMLGAVFRRDAVQPLHAHPDGGAVDPAAQRRDSAEASAQGCRRGGDLCLLQLRPVPGRLSDERAEEESEILIGLFHSLSAPA